MKLTCTFLGLLAALSLAACSGGGGGDSSSPSTGTTPTTGGNSGGTSGGTSGGSGGSSPSASPSPTATVSPSPTATASPTATVSPSPTATVSPSPSASPSPSPVAGCPTNYELVSANSSLGTNDFCIAKFEMKQVNSVATSQAAAVPWIANKATATSACSSLGGTYRLPTNAEWNAAALEIYNEATNWTGGAKLSGTLYTGMYSAWTAPVAVTNTSNPYDSTGTASGVERRTFTLASGNTIWDFGGNAWEWVSDTIYGNSFTPDLSSNGPFKYWYDSYQFPQSSAQMLKFTGMTTVPDSIDYRLGNFFGGSSGLVIRGGAAAMNNAGVVGIFTANIGDITANELRAPASWSLQMDNVGFRCVATPGQY